MAWIANNQEKSVSAIDDPSSSLTWDDLQRAGADETATECNRDETFTTHLVVQNTTWTDKYHCLKYVKWTIDYDATIDCTQAVGSRVTIDEGNSESAITAQGDGDGGDPPELQGPRANDANQATWQQN